MGQQKKSNRNFCGILRKPQTGGNRNRESCWRPCAIVLPSLFTCSFLFLVSRLRHQAHKELYAYKQVILKEKVKELNLHEICAVCLEEFKPKDELGICPCKHAFHRKCLIKWLEVRKVCPLCNMPVLQLAQLHSKQDHPGPTQEPLPGAANIV
ncbi:RING finger protein 24 [Sphaerodactylus townsendi]|uniref:RING finger protein 24 n=1 Tax=Sphaerodactylus townsendi TaxID=933632 RepID=UPI002026466B|nr:RING finger protein 24 [Sphaerodactylus townsendi]